MINRRTVREVYSRIEPTGEQKERMLTAICAEAKPQTSARKPPRIVWVVAALMVLIMATAVSAAEPFKRLVTIKETISDVNEPVTVNIVLDEEILDEILPQIEVEPYFFTGEDVRRVANALFKDAEFYEFEPEPVYTKEQIQAKLDRWNKYTNADAVEELIGHDPMKPELPGEIAQMVQEYVEIYEIKYETAPSGEQRTPCRWDFQSEMYYMYTQEEIAAENPEQYGAFNQGIQATVIYEGIPYTLVASQRDLDDFKVNNISAYIHDGFSPRNIDWEIFHAQLCCTPEPTGEQLDAVKQKAQDILYQIGFGQWMVDECYVKERASAGNTEYVVCVNAVPVLQGIPAVRSPQLDVLRDPETGEKYYYYTDANFRFSANGDLLWFELFSPVTITDTEQSIHKQLSVDALLEIAKEYLKKEVYEQYNTIPNSVAGEGNYYCVIDVTGLDYSLTRIKGDGDYVYLYTPGMTLTGDIRYYEKGTHKLIREITDHTFLVMNGLDGTIIG